MIIKGKSRTHGNALGNYLLSEGRYATNREDNERIAIWEAAGIAEGVRLHTLLRSFEASAAQSQCEKPLYHVQMRTADGEHLDRQRWLASVDTLEAKLGLTSHDRVIVAHTKDRQDHVHVVWNRIDNETGRAAELSHDGLKRLEVARTLENELGLRKLGHERGGKLSAKEEAFAARHGKDPQQIKDILQTCWHHADTGKEFAAHLDAYGMTLAKGDKRGFLAVDREGDFYLVSRATGTREKEVREKLADLDRDQLPSLQQVRDQAKERLSADLLHKQQIDRNRLEVKQWRDIQRLEDRLTHQEDMRDRVQQMTQEEREAQQKRTAARTSATLYDRGDMASMQRDALRELRAKFTERERQDRQAQRHQRREAGTERYHQTAYGRMEERHTRQTGQLEVQQYFERKRAGVVDRERDRSAERLLLSKAYDKATAQTTLTAEHQEHIRALREQQEQERRERERQQRGTERQTEGSPVEMSDAMAERAARRGGRALTERERMRQALEDIRERAGITVRGEGRERERER